MGLSAPPDLIMCVHYHGGLEERGLHQEHSPGGRLELLRILEVEQLLLVGVQQLLLSKVLWVVVELRGGQGHGGQQSNAEDAGDLETEH